MAEREHLLSRRNEPETYDQDYAAWLARQAGLLRSGELAEVDAEHLAEEVEDLGKSDFREFVSAIEVVLLHMLKWHHQPERRTRSWALSIAEHRLRIADALNESPSYRSRRDDAVSRAYPKARLGALRETSLPARELPEECPYDWDAIVSREYPIDDTR